MNDPTVQPVKMCRKCGKEKPRSTEFFYRNPQMADRHHSWCKACMRAFGKKRPRKTPKLTPEIFAARLWSKVDKGGPVPIHVPELGPCWLWTAYRNKYGYGEVGRSHPRRVETVHRVTWELEHGPAGDLCVLHRCDNPGCCNPAHLFLGTRTENMLDKVRKGRQHRGERASAAMRKAWVTRRARTG